MRCGCCGELIRLPSPAQFAEIRLAVEDKVRELQLDEELLAEYVLAPYLTVVSAALTMHSFKCPAPARDGATVLGPNGSGQLTAREHEVLVLLARGLSDRKIASTLSLSPHTVLFHVRNLRRKMGHSSRLALVAAAASALGADDRRWRPSLERQNLGMSSAYTAESRTTQAASHT